MSTNTTNLVLYKADPVVDKDNTFNIKTMLNDNWDKLDANALLKAPLANPALSGIPLAPTALAGTTTTQIATTAFVQAALAVLIGSAPTLLNTLQEIDNALNNDPNLYTDVMTAIANSLTTSETYTNSIAGALSSLSTIAKANLVASINEIVANVATNAATSATALASHSADLTKHDGTIDDTGLANAYAITLNPVPISYAEYQTFKFKAKFANTGASTLNVNVLGAKSLVKDVNIPLIAGDILAGQIITAVYDGTNFQITPDYTAQFALKAPLTNPIFTGVATLPTNSVSDSLLISLNAVVIATGTTQATATALTKDENVITTGTGGVVVQGATTGKIVVVINKTASPVNIYPASGHYFDGLAVNIPISLPVNAFIELYGFSTTQWNSTINAVTNAMNTILADAGGYFTTKNVEAALQQEASTVNMHLADSVKHPAYVVTTGSANTYIATLSPAPTSYIDGMGIVAKINVVSTGASTINVNGLGAKAILDSLGNAITSGGLKANTPYTVRYESVSSSFIVQGKGGGGNLTAGDLVSGKTATGDSGPIVGTLALVATAVVANILATKTAYLTDPKNAVTGTMVNHTGVDSVASSSVGTGGGTVYARPVAGFYSGSEAVTVYDANHIPANIVSGVTDFGVVGTASNIKSIQRGSVVLSAVSTNITISGVDLTKAVIRMTSSPTSYSGYFKNILANATFVNATTINFSVPIYLSSINITWEVIEFNNVKSIQNGISSSGLSTTTVTVANVNPLKSTCFFSQRSNSSDSAGGATLASCTLTNATTLTFNANNNYTANAMEYTWTLIEFN